MNFIMNRLKQPSTYRGLAVLTGLIGYSVSPELADAIGLAVVALLSAIEIFRDEHKKPEVANVQQAESSPEPQRIISPELTDRTTLDNP